MAASNEYDGADQFSCVHNEEAEEITEVLDATNEGDKIVIEHGILPAHMPPKTRAKMPFYRHGKTPADKAANILNKAKIWYIHQIMTVDCKECFKDLSDVTGLRKYLNKNPVGEISYKRSKNPQFFKQVKCGDGTTEKTLYKNLKVLQDKLYAYLRASLPKYMDKTAKATYENWIRTEESKKANLNRDNYMDRGVRITWARIKLFVIEKCCQQTLGSFYFIQLLRLKRKDDILFHHWTSQGGVRNVCPYA